MEERELSPIIGEQLVETNDPHGMYRPKKKRPTTKLSFISIATVVSIASVTAVVTVLVLITSANASASRIVFPESSSPMGIYSSSAIASDNGNCSIIGGHILRRRGSAVDAAIAALICNGVVNMNNMGIGGGLFAVVWDNNTNQAVAIDSYGVSPGMASEALYATNPLFKKTGNLSILVPGEVAGYQRIHEKYGKLPWRSLFEPSIKLCNQGFYVGPALASAIRYFSGKADSSYFSGMDNLISMLHNPRTNDWYREGELMVNRRLGKTLQIIAENGGDYFYSSNSSLLQSIIDDLSDFGSIITQTDLISYQTISERKPIELKFRDGLKLFATQPSSSGASAAFVLNILSGYNWTSASDGYDPLNYHRYLEALKFAWGQWSYFGDIAFLDKSELDKRLVNMTSLEMGNRVRELINDDYVLPLEAYGTYGTPSIFDEHESTSHVSAIDASGMAISITSTINKYFGSYLMGNRTGILFNNGMNNFFLRDVKRRSSSLPQPPHNFIQPGKRPMTTLSPMVFVKDNSVQLIVGASGGNRIVATVPYVALRVLYFNETVKQSVDAFRLLTKLYPDALYYESQWPQWVLNYLRDKGHTNQKVFTSSRSSICQAIQLLPNHTIFAISDFRKGGAFTDGF